MERFLEKRLVKFGIDQDNIKNENFEETLTKFSEGKSGEPGERRKCKRIGKEKQGAFYEL